MPTPSAAMEMRRDRPDVVLLDVHFDIPAPQLLGWREGLSDGEVRELAGNYRPGDAHDSNPTPVRGTTGMISCQALYKAGRIKSFMAASTTAKSLCSVCFR